MPMPPRRSRRAPHAAGCAVLIVQSKLDQASPLVRVIEDGDLAGRVIVVADATEAEEYLFREGRYRGAGGRPVPLFMLLDIADLASKAGLLGRMRADPLLRYVVLVAVSSELESQDGLAIENVGIVLYLKKPTTLPECRRFAEQLKRLIPADVRGA